MRSGLKRDYDHPGTGLASLRGPVSTLIQCTVICVYNYLSSLITWTQGPGTAVENVPVGYLAIDSILSRCHPAGASASCKIPGVLDTARGEWQFALRLSSNAHIVGAEPRIPRK